MRAWLIPSVCVHTDYQILQSCVSLSLVVHTCNPNYGIMRQEDKEFKAILGNLERVKAVVAHQ